jgi:hypothetical protein
MPARFACLIAPTLAQPRPGQQRAATGNALRALQGAGRSYAAARMMVTWRSTVRMRFSTVDYFERDEFSRRIYESLRLSATVSASELTDAAMVGKKLTDTRIRPYFVTRFLSRLSQMAVEGQTVRLRDADGLASVGS